VKAIFLSASVPIEGRGDYYKTSNPFLIQVAVRELVVATISSYKIVWGGHPSITPMIWTICRDLGADYSRSVELYQSRYFQDRFPEENKRFRNVNFIDAVHGSLEDSLLHMRENMLSRDDLVAAVFIGGMDGVEAEYELFKRYHPGATVLPVAAPGGAARVLAKRLGQIGESHIHDVDFARLFRTNLIGSDYNPKYR